MTLKNINVEWKLNNQIIGEHGIPEVHIAMETDPFLTGRVLLENCSETTINIKKLAVVLISGEGYTGLSIDNQDPETAHVSPMFQKPIRRTGVILWEKSRKLKPGSYEFPFKIAYPSNVPPTLLYRDETKCMTHVLHIALRLEKKQILLKSSEVIINRAISKVKAKSVTKAGLASNGKIYCTLSTFDTIWIRNEISIGKLNFTLADKTADQLYLQSLDSRLIEKVAYGKEKDVEKYEQQIGPILSYKIEKEHCSVGKTPSKELPILFPKTPDLQPDYVDENTRISHEVEFQLTFSTSLDFEKIYVSKIRVPALLQYKDESASEGAVSEGEFDLQTPIDFSQMNGDGNLARPISTIRSILKQPVKPQKFSLKKLFTKKTSNVNKRRTRVTFDYNHQRYSTEYESDSYPSSVNEENQEENGENAPEENQADDLQNVTNQANISELVGKERSVSVDSLFTDGPKEIQKSDTDFNEKKLVQPTLDGLKNEDAALKRSNSNPIKMIEKFIGFKRGRSNSVDTVALGNSKASSLSFENQILESESHVAKSSPLAAEQFSEQNSVHADIGFEKEEFAQEPATIKQVKPYRPPEDLLSEVSFATDVKQINPYDALISEGSINNPQERNEELVELKQKLKNIEINNPTPISRKDKNNRHEHLSLYSNIAPSVAYTEASSVFGSEAGAPDYDPSLYSPAVSYKSHNVFPPIPSSQKERRDSDILFAIDNVLSSIEDNSEKKEATIKYTDYKSPLSKNVQEDKSDSVNQKLKPAVSNRRMKSANSASKLASSPLAPPPNESLPLPRKSKTSPAKRNSRRPSNLLPIFSAITTFVPERPDELRVEIGQLVQIKEIITEGWAYGLNMQTGKQGLLPLDIFETQLTREELHEHWPASVKKLQVTATSEKL